jgi:hypothetical protein
MNNKELREFILKDKNKIEVELIRKTEECFHAVLGVAPDTVDVSDKRQTSSYFSVDFVGYKCTLDGANFYAGEEMNYNWCAPHKVVYQVGNILFYKKRFLRKPASEIKQEFIRIRRPADIIWK